ncbi:MAG: FecR family protein [Spirochaetota bacterium]
MKKFLIVLAVCGAAFGATPGATDTIAVFRSVNGTVSVESTDGKKKSPAKNGMAVAVGLLIRTAALAKAELALADGSLITIGEKSAIVLNRNLIGTKGKNNTSFGVLMGGMKLKVNKLTGSDEMKVQTPTAVAAVRGTDFEVSLASDGSTMVAVNEGKVNVKGDGSEGNVSMNESASVILGEENAGVKPMAKKDDSLDSFLKERDAAVKKDPAGTMGKMEARAGVIGEKGGSLLVNAGDASADHTALNDVYNQVKNGNESIKLLADSVLAENSENPNVKRAYNTLKRIYEANGKLEAKIAAALAKIDARVNAVNQKIDTKSKMLDSLELNK